jgi:serine/threonine-protein kinase
VIPQLIRVADDTHVWADTYDETMTEVFRVQSDIAERVATQLDVALLEPERRVIERKPTDNLDAYEHFLRAEEHRLSIKRKSDAELAIEQYRKAVSLDPQFVEAWAGLAIAYRLLYWSFDVPDAFAPAKEAAKRAEEIAPDHPETHLALGYIDYSNREFGKALAHFEKAQRLRPSGDAARAIGYTLRRFGKWQKALDHFKEGHRLIPHSYELYVDDLGYTNVAMRRYDEAEENYHEAITLDPRVAIAYLYKARILLARDGDVNAAKEVLLQMSRWVDVTEVAEIEASVYLECAAGLRILSEQYAEYFNAFERTRMERVRLTQPALIANTHLAQALITEVREGRPSAVGRYDSARVCYERLIRSNPQSAYISLYHAGLGHAYAGLGRRKEAMREGEEAVRMVPLSKDAVRGEQALSCFAEICVMCGEHERALDQIETLLSVPGYTSPTLLRTDPIWDPIRNNPRFRRLAEGK